MLNFEQCWQVPVGTRLYGLMPAARQCMIPRFLDALRRVSRTSLVTGTRCRQWAATLTQAKCFLMPCCTCRASSLHTISQCTNWGGTIPGKTGEPSHACSHDCSSIHMQRVHPTDPTEYHEVWVWCAKVELSMEDVPFNLRRFQEMEAAKIMMKHRIPVEYRTETYWIWVWTYYKSNIEYVWMCDMGVYIHNNII